LVLPPVVTVDVLLVVVVVLVDEDEEDEEETKLVVFEFAVVDPPVVVVGVLAACEAQPAKMRHANGKRISLMDFFIMSPPGLSLAFIPYKE